MINALVELSQKPWLTVNLTIHIPFMSPIKECFCNGLFLVILLKYHRELIKYWNKTWTIFLRHHRVRSSLQQYSYFRRSYTLIQGSFKSDMMQQCFKKIYLFTVPYPHMVIFYACFYISVEKYCRSLKASGFCWYLNKFLKGKLPVHLR